MASVIHFPLTDYTVKSTPQQYTKAKTNNHTTSTKCQYHAENSNNAWCWREKWFFTLLQYEINNKQVPTTTWNPCKPVNIKKVDPYIPSTKVYLVKPYSKYWSQLKIIPNVTAVYNPFNTTGLQPAIIPRWAATSATPDVNKTTVFTNGNMKGSRVSSKWIPSGGQIPPTLIDGDKLAWKKAQKKGKNSIASDAKNSNIPYFRPTTTFEVW